MASRCVGEMGNAPGSIALKALHRGGTVRALNVFGVVALVALAFYVGWALVGGADDDRDRRPVPAATPAATTPALR